MVRTGFVSDPGFARGLKTEKLALQKLGALFARLPPIVQARATKPRCPSQKPITSRSSSWSILIRIKPLTPFSTRDCFWNGGWRFPDDLVRRGQRDESQRFVSANFRGQSGTYGLMVTVDETDDLVQVFGFLPLIVPPHKLAAGSELCVRLSHSLKVGRFELNHADGELRFQTYSAYTAGDLKEEVLRRVFGVNLSMIDQHFPAFIAVIYTEVTPDQAAQEVRARMVKGQGTAPAAGVAMPERFKLN